ncbi:glycosyltransferase family 4 protein [Candidatus Peregrinibacteria bacterium]|nr:glycosyltransferase family 4 protein [Candidatus Peregrinibacteria bacterium]
MKLLMISGDRSVLQGKKSAFYYTLEEFCKHWERIDIITPITDHSLGTTNLFGKVFFHPSPRGLWYQSWWILKKGKELIAEYHHDVMTVHEYPPFYNGLGAKWLHKKTKIPYVLEIHHIVGYPVAASWQEFIGRWMSWVFLKWDTKSATAVRCVNRETQRVLDDWGLKNIGVVPSFYLDRGVLGPDPSIEKQYDVVFCGRDVPNKGLQELRNATNNINASLLAIGTDVWIGTKEEVYKAMQSGKIFVMNSKSEGGPRALLEAMALGMPVISTRVGIAPDVIKDGVNGIFTTGEASDLKGKIKMLLDDEGLRRCLGQEACKVLDRFDREVLVKRYADFLKKL